jgi:tetratricopeptide (TPR) repeat protein
VRSKAIVVVILLASSGVAEDRVPKPVECSQLLAWIAGGIPEQRLLRLVRERGRAFPMSESRPEILSSVGLQHDFVDHLEEIDTAVGSATFANCPADLVKAAQLVHQQNYPEAQPIVRKLLVSSPNDADLHLAFGYIRLQQDDLDEAFDGYADAKDLNPTFPEIHNGLSEVFYKSGDAENAIAEARTALSIDPQNAEGYRHLGLGFFADQKYAAALHAFRESLSRDPGQAETYYDIGRAQAEEKDFAAAAESYKKAIHLNPDLADARSQLSLVLRELAEGQKSPAKTSTSQ